MTRLYFEETVLTHHAQHIKPGTVCELKNYQVWGRYVSLLYKFATGNYHAKLRRTSLQIPDVGGCFARSRAAIEDQGIARERQGWHQPTVRSIDGFVREGRARMT